MNITVGKKYIVHVKLINKINGCLLLLKQTENKKMAIGKCSENGVPDLLPSMLMP